MTLGDGFLARMDCLQQAVGCLCALIADEILGTNLQLVAAVGCRFLILLPCLAGRLCLAGRVRLAGRLGVVLSTFGGQLEDFRWFDRLPAEAARVEGEADESHRENPERCSLDASDERAANVFNVNFFCGATNFSLGGATPTAVQ